MTAPVLPREVTILARSRSLIPVGPDKRPWCEDGEHPLPWKKYQTEKPTGTDLTRWVSQAPPAWAQITGAFSGTVTIDFDGEQGQLLAQEWGVQPHRRTPHGLHLDVRHPGWPVPTLNGKAAEELGHRWPGLDIKGDGGYAIVSGSLEAGNYDWLRDPEPDDPDVVPAEVWDFLAQQREKTLPPPERPSNGHRIDAERLISRAIEQTSSSGRNVAGFWLACQLRDNGFTLNEAEGAMRDYCGRVQPVNLKGQHEPYTWLEAQSSLRQAYRSPPREPWHLPSNGDLNPRPQIQNDLDRQARTTNKDGDLNLNPAGLRITRVADVAREKVSWRWRDRLARGKVHVFEGDPGTGKSWLTEAITTAATRGTALPGDTGEFKPKNVLVFTAEDGIADTVRPRLEDMGADIERVHVVESAYDADGVEHFPSLTQDLLLIEAELATGKYEMMILDPINAYLKGIDGNRDIELRSILGPLAQLAERYGVIIICVRHLTKSARDRAIYRGQGGIGYVAAARVTLLVGLNPDDKTERIVVPIKNNLAPLAEPIAFEIVDGQFRWKGTSEVTAEQLLAADIQPEERSKAEEARDYLIEALADGPRPPKPIYNEAQGIGISARTLERAKSALGVIAEPYYEDGRRGAAGWKWRLPDRQWDLDRHSAKYRNDGDLNDSRFEATPKPDTLGDVNQTKVCHAVNCGNMATWDNDYGYWCEVHP